MLQDQLLLLGFIKVNLAYRASVSIRRRYSAVALYTIGVRAKLNVPRSFPQMQRRNAGVSADLMTGRLIVSPSHSHC